MYTISKKVYISILTLTILLCYKNKLNAQNVKQIDILNSEVFETDQNIANGAPRFIGDVKIKLDSAIMYCDSAYYYPNKKLVYAYSNVHIIQNDTLHLYGDSAKYQGDIKLAKFRSNVKLVDKETVLTTQFLDFDMNKNVGYYFNNGKVVNKEDTLTSKTGYYYSNDKIFYFKDDVVIKNPKYNIYSDTLQYNTITRKSSMFGPTEIISEENYIYCENGWYNTKTNISQFNENAYITNHTQKILGDSIYYERNTGYGKAFFNVEIIDTTNSIILKGDFAEYFEKQDSSLIIDSALFIHVSGLDSMYIHSDTLCSVLDTLGKRVVKAYHKVKIFRHNIQGMCDSMIYSVMDSTIRLFDEPVIWSENYQLTAEYIIIHTNQGNIDFVEMNLNSFIISEEDTAFYNQIKGKNMIGYFTNNDLKVVDVKGNGETIYYPENNGEVIGINKVISSDITIYFKDRSPDTFKFKTKPNANLIPLDFPEASDNRLKGFNWLGQHRPLEMKDIFIWEK